MDNEFEIELTLDCGIVCDFEKFWTGQAALWLETCEWSSSSPTITIRDTKISEAISD